MEISEKNIHRSQKQVLVTGGTGFIATYCMLQLLKEGYSVRTTIRSSGLQSTVQSQLARAGGQIPHNISFFITDLRADTGWAEAVSGCDYVLHIASPFPYRKPKNESDLIVPARNGTLRVLKAAGDAAFCG